MKVSNNHQCDDTCPSCSQKGKMVVEEDETMTADGFRGDPKFKIRYKFCSNCRYEYEKPEQIYVGPDNEYYPD